MDRLEYEIHGKVQGVFFRKYTKKQADKLNLTGWVQNTEHKTVIGVAVVSSAALSEFMEWLKKTGSPKSRIDKAEFNRQKIDQSEFNEFTIRR